MMQYSLKLPRAVYCGEGAISAISAVLRESGARRVALFTDANIIAAGLVDPVLAQLTAMDVTFEVIDGIPPEPTYLQAQAVADRCGAFNADYLIAVGGGSVLDCAKLASVTHKSGVTLLNLLDDSSLAHRSVPLLAIPTTAGTGAEATPNAIVAVPEKELKVGIVNEALIPEIAVLDPEMIRQLPPKIAASTGVDALCHAIECYTSNKANPLSDTFALEACQRILHNILPAYHGDMAAKLQMQIAAFYGGVAITASGTTGVHALSYPLGGKYHIAHGVSNAMLLCPVFRFNEPAIRERLARVYDRACQDAQRLTTDAEKSAYMIGWLERIVRELQIPASLRDFNVPSEDLEGLVQAGMQVTRLLSNNMRPIEANEAREIYRQIL